MIYFLPWGNKNIASSRLRVHQIAPYLDVEYSFVLPQKYKKGDILVIQKKPRLQELEKAKREDAKVIYDLDDLYLEDINTQQMIKEADVITVAGEYMRDKYLKKAIMIPDSLDWDGTMKNTYSDNTRLLAWTSYGNNTPYFKNVYTTLKIRYDFLIVSSFDFLDHFEKDKIWMLYPWSLENADKDLSKADAGIIPLSDNEFCKSKTMHRLLKFWAIGLPCYVSPIPDYKKAILEVGASKKCIITNWDELPDIEWNENLRNYALKYHPRNIAKLWSSLFKETL